MKQVIHAESPPPTTLNRPPLVPKTTLNRPPFFTLNRPPLNRYGYAFKVLTYKYLPIIGCAYRWITQATAQHRHRKRPKGRGTPAGFPRFAAPPPAENVAASGQPFTKRGQAAHAAPPPHPGQTAVGTPRPQKRFFRKGRPTASTPNKPRDWPTLSHPPRPFPLGRGALHCPWGLAGRMCAFGFFLPSADRLGSFQGRQGPGLRPSPGRPVSSLRCGPRQPPLRPLTPFPLEKRSGSAAAARRGRFRGLAYPKPPQDRKTRCRGW